MVSDNNKRDLLVKAFVQKVCTRTSTGKRFVAIRKLLALNVPWNDKQCAHIWKGLFYAIWYSEMNKGGEELIINIASSCETRNLLLTGFETLAREWFGIDYIRIDKFMFLVRQLMRTTFRLELKEVEGIDGNEAPTRPILVEEIIGRIEKTRGLMYHFTEIYLEELKRALDEKRSTKSARRSEVIVTLLTPFANVMSRSDDSRTLDTISESIFINLKKELLSNESKDTKEHIFNQLIDALISSTKERNDEIKSKNRRAIHFIVKRFKRQVIIKRLRTDSSKCLKRKLTRIDNSNSKRFKWSLIPLPLED